MLSNMYGKKHLSPPLITQITSSAINGVVDVVRSMLRPHEHKSTNCNTI